MALTTAVRDKQLTARSKQLTDPNYQCIPYNTLIGNGVASKGLAFGGVRYERGFGFGR